MRYKHCILGPVVAAFTLIGSFTGEADAALSLLIDAVSTDSLTVSISGTLDATTVGLEPGWIVIKNDYSANVGVHTEMFSGFPTISGSMTIGGVAVNTTFSVNGNGFTHHDAITFENPTGAKRDDAIAAGTAVSGTVTLTGVGAFNPANLTTLELASGFNGNGTAPDPFRWGRFEAVAVPEPSRMLLAFVGLGTVAFRRRRS